MEKLKLEVNNIIAAASKGKYHGVNNYLLWDRVKNDLTIAIRDYEKSNKQKDAGENCFFRGGHGCGNIRLDVPWKNRECVMEQGKIYVKTVYSKQHIREPNISEYDSIEDANTFIDTCLKWGIGIASCEIISGEMSKEVQNGDVVR